MVNKEMIKKRSDLVLTTLLKSLLFIYLIINIILKVSLLALLHVHK